MISAKAVPLHYFCDNEENSTCYYFTHYCFTTRHHRHPGFLDKEYAGGKRRAGV